MNKRPASSLYLSALIPWIGLTFFSLLGVNAMAADPADIADGGRLYDKWWAELRMDAPKGTHPSYPGAGKKKGADSWRCKECHGWDYRGKHGTYASGSHATGIPGIRGSANAPIEKIVKLLGNRIHQYNRILDKSELETIALFVSAGQVDMDQYIDRKTRQAKGTASSGKAVFATYCADCHGDDGKEYNFKEKSGGQEYLGTIAKKNPWEVMHKMMNGQPEETKRNMDHRQRNMRHGMGMMHKWRSMPAMRGREEMGTLVNLLAYLQTLPEK